MCYGFHDLFLTNHNVVDIISGAPHIQGGPAKVRPTYIFAGNIFGNI